MGSVVCYGKYGVFMGSVECLWKVGSVYGKYGVFKPVPMATQSKVWVGSRSLAGIAGSNPVVGMKVSLL
jgi:hypothetical protein